ncbi:MAG: GMC oxidoreductase [Candidatus Entotheonellia bacterium]
MHLIDVNDLEPTSAIAADVCIVGAGAAGITVASELDGSSQTVCLVESGSHGPDAETQSLYDIDIVGYPVRENFMSRARYFGGSCNLWAGRSMKLTELDIAPREWIPHSGWPITYAELDRYYGRAEKILRVPSFERFEHLTLRRQMGQQEKPLFDNDDLKPNISMWAKKPLRFGAAYRAQLKRSRKISVYLNANVTEILLNREGTSVEALSVATLSGKRLRIKAKRFVLACGGMETARLLLVSRGVQKEGIGNQFDVVGRYYMDHPRTVFGKVKLSGQQRLPLLLGVPLSRGMAQVGIQFSERVQQRERLLNHYLTFERQWSEQAAKAYQSFVHTMKIVLRKGYSGNRFSLSGAKLAKVPELIYLLAPRELMPHFLYRMVKAVKNRISGGVTELIVVNYCEQAPTPQSRVYLSHERDKLQMNRLVLDWKVGDDETRSLMRLQDLVDHYLRKHHIGYLDNTSQKLSDLHYTDASHHIGTTRMSADPRAGVVDSDSKVHGVDNLFIAGSAIFPTCGYANPTLTIVALAIRLAEHLKGIRE